MPDVIAAVTIHTGQGVFPPGSVVTVKTKAEADALIAAGNAEPVPHASVPVSDLPDDIPGRAALAKAGLTLDQVSELVENEGLLEVEGIGPATLDEIEAWFDGDEGDETE